MNDGPAAGERISRRARRARDHEAVAAVRVDEAAVDPDFEFDHAPGFLPLHDDVIERAVAELGARPRARAVPRAAGARRSRSGPRAPRRRSPIISSGSTSVRKPSRPRLTPSSGTPRASASCAAKSIVPSPPIATMRSASCPSSAHGLADEARRAGPSIAASRSSNTVRSARAQVRGEQLPANRRRGRLRPCRPGRCGRSACSFGFAAF